MKLLIVTDDVGLATRVSALGQHGFITMVRNTNGLLPTIEGFCPDMILIDFRLANEEFLKDVRGIIYSRKIVVTVFGGGIREFGSQNILKEGKNIIPLWPDRSATMASRIFEIADRNKDAFIKSTGSFVLNSDRKLTYVDSKFIMMTEHQYVITSALINNKLRATSREDLCRSIYYRGGVASVRAIDVQISRLRQKVKLIYTGDFIKTLYGSGYILIPDVQQEKV